eukprot:g6614.t1
MREALATARLLIIKKQDGIKDDHDAAKTQRLESANVIRLRKPIKAAQAANFQDFEPRAVAAVGRALPRARSAAHAAARHEISGPRLAIAPPSATVQKSAWLHHEPAATACFYREKDGAFFTSGLLLGALAEFHGHAMKPVGNLAIHKGDCCHDKCIRVQDHPAKGFWQRLSAHVFGSRDRKG